METRSLTAGEILNIWETGRSRRPLERAWLLLAHACPDASGAELAALTVGQRNARLIALRWRTFGPAARCRAACPACGAELEFMLDLPGLAAAEPEVAVYRDILAGYSLEYRLPTAGDLAAIAAAGNDPGGARQELIARCVLGAERDGEAVSPAGLPAAVVEALGEAIRERDPLAGLRLALDCAACGQRSSVPFDAAAFVWSELEMQARRLLREVHSLARAYGWREGDILALSPARRQAYLELAAG